MLLGGSPGYTRNVPAVLRKRLLDVVPYRFGHAELAAMLAEAEASAAQLTDVVDTSAALSAYQASNDADEVSEICCH